ncbi:MAG: TspO and MBR [Patescibacteria group bacterium]|nr:MAG: TspO and MBR [Patescibacteria group bacterium]
MPKHHFVKLESPFKSPIKLFFSITLPFFVQAVGSFVTNPSLPGWYESLNKPELNPPNWLFAPVWTTLYFLMGISLYLVWSSDSKSKIKRPAILLFFVHLALNSLWSFVFFDWLDISLALLVIITIWLLIVLLMILFSRINKLASYLLIPYLVWVSFATYVNFEFWRLN